jgi:ABC-type hemin transport system substrate-binding protein
LVLVPQFCLTTCAGATVNTSEVKSVQPAELFKTTMDEVTDLHITSNQIDKLKGSVSSQLEQVQASVNTQLDDLTKKIGAALEQVCFYNHFMEEITN